MDEGSECSVLESVEDNEFTNNNNHPQPDYILNGDGDGNKVEVNGSCLNEIHDKCTGGDSVSDGLLHDGQVKSVEIEQQENSVSSPPLAAKSPDGGSPVTSKGYGLRKWRRIKREPVKDGNLNSDSGKVLKRGLSGSSNPSKPTNITPINGRQNSEGSVGSTNAMRAVGVADGFLTHEYSLESRFAIGSAFAAGTDSENSEDRSSKSSTAASVPRLRHDLPVMLGHIREKNRIKNLSSMVVSTSTLRSQQGKARAESSKKPRGERVKIEKENSHSSIESDSRSSKFVFTQGAYSMNSNGKQSESSMNYDGENSDDAHVGEQEFGDEVQTGFGQVNIGEVEDHSRDGLAAEASWEEKEEKSENHLPSKNQDPLVESILSLHLVHDALENEVKKLGEIGKASSLPADSTFREQGINDSSSSDEFDSGNVKQPSSLDSEVLTLKANVKNLESRLEETTAMLKVKESMISELETTLNTSISPKEESSSTTEMHLENSREMEIELEGLFKQKIEAEIVYLTLLRTIQKLRVATGDQVVTLLDEQEALAVEQSQMLNKLGEAENKAAMLKKEAEHLEKYCADILGTKEVMKMQKKVCKVTTCFLMQLVLLLLVFYLLLLQFSPHSGVVVPT